MLDIKTVSDLELSKLMGTSYQELMRVNANLAAISNELARREAVVKPVIDETSVPQTPTV